MSKNTENYKLYTFTSDSDVADLKLLEPTFDTIDKGLVLDVGESTGSGNNYILNLGSITLTSANKGISFKFWSDKDSKGAVTINGTYKLIKAGGSSVTNLKKAAPYTVTYDGGTNFFLASGGGTDTVTFTSDKLLTGYSANNSNGEKVNGTMPNNGTVTQSLSANGSLTLPSGYYDSIKITQNIPNRGEYQMAGGIGSDGDYISFNKIPYGYYPQSSNGWAPEIRAKKTDVVKNFGITADKIAEGKNILGVTGTYKSSNDIWAYTPGTITLPSTRTDTTIVSIPFEPSIVMAFSMTETGKTYSTTNPLGGDIRWGVGNGRFFKIMSGSYAFKFTDVVSNRTCIQDVTYSGGKLTIDSSGSYGGSDFRYTFMIIAIR